MILQLVDFKDFSLLELSDKKPLASMGYIELSTLKELKNNVKNVRAANRLSRLQKKNTVAKKAIQS